MAYIARTNGGNTVIEVITANLDDIPEDDRVNWRLVTAIQDPIDPFTTIRTTPSFVVSQDGTVVNMVWDTVNVDPLLVKAKLKEVAAKTRWEKQQAGVFLPDGTKIKTDDASQAKIHQAFSILKEGWVASINFKTSSGWVEVDLATMTAISQAVSNYVQNCFNKEKEILTAIDAGTVTSANDILNWNW